MPFDGLCYLIQTKLGNFPIPFNYLNHTTCSFQPTYTLFNPFSASVKPGMIQLFHSCENAGPAPCGASYAPIIADGNTKHNIYE